MFQQQGNQHTDLVAVVEVHTVQLIQMPIFIMVLQEVLVAVVAVIVEHK